MMYMMKIKNIVIFSLLLFVAVACGDDSDLIAEQREDIITFLESSHSPVLIAESAIADSIEDDPEFYTVISYGVFRYIEDYYNSSRASKQEVKSGDTLTLTFWSYDFSGYTTPTSSNLFYTNDPTYEYTFESAGMNTEYWSFEPLEIVLGKGDILKAIETSLVGCKEGDNVEIYLTYDSAYGSTWIGVSNLEEPIAFFCTIESIEN